MQKLNENQMYQLAFNSFQKFGPLKIRQLEYHFTSLKEAFHATEEELLKIGLKESLITKFINWRALFNLNDCLNELEKENIRIITWHDSNYPAILLEINSPPPVLYYKGDISMFNSENNYLAIVGSRLHSAYANIIISELLPNLIEHKLIIVSGLAYGVDTLVHKETLLNNGKTIAVLGCGLNDSVIYPAENRELAREIVKNNGLILSEFPPKTGPLKTNFPQRNRIIAGLCQATLVIESKAKSGSLITAYQALEQNREVLAIPGSIFSEYSQGPNSLIKRGAKTISDSTDILETFGLD
jgi:DNA processing protein